LLLIMFVTSLFVLMLCASAPLNAASSVGGSGDVNVWLTSASDNNLRLKKQDAELFFNDSAITNNFVTVDLDSTITYQSVEGFGFSLTGGSAIVINQLDPSARSALLQELFSLTAEEGIRINYLRISLGASDLSDRVFTYDDMPEGETDEDLSHFSLSPEEADMVPLLQDILKINPDVRILATPWSAPSWMKTNKSSKGGNLIQEYYSAYAQYFVLYIQQMKLLYGITIHEITPQNEPLNPYNNPSMVMSADEQSAFIQGYLGPALHRAQLSTRIITFDHNCDEPSYPLTVLAQDQANGFVHGSAFHLYAGDISALSAVHDAYPDKSVYFTEQWTSSEGDFGGDLLWAVKNVVVGALNNWAVTSLEWNLANDPAFSPHTDGGCTQCKGALTIDAAGGATAISRNVAYYIIGHASKFIPRGSTRIAATSNSKLDVVAFRIDGQSAQSYSRVLLVENDTNEDITFNIRVDKQRWVTTSLQAGVVGSYTLRVD